MYEAGAAAATSQLAAAASQGNWAKVATGGVHSAAAAPDRRAARARTPEVVPRAGPARGVGPTAPEKSQRIRRAGGDVTEGSDEAGLRDVG